LVATDDHFRGVVFNHLSALDFGRRFNFAGFYFFLDLDTLKQLDCSFKLEVRRQKQFAHHDRAFGAILVYLNREH
jgi:hypothetical protein